MRVKISNWLLNRLILRTILCSGLTHLMSYVNLNDDDRAAFLNRINFLVPAFSILPMQYFVFAILANFKFNTTIWCSYFCSDQVRPYSEFAAAAICIINNCTADFDALGTHFSSLLFYTAFFCLFCYLSFYITQNILWASPEEGAIYVSWNHSIK